MTEKNVTHQNDYKWFWELENILYERKNYVYWKSPLNYYLKVIEPLFILLLIALLEITAYFHFKGMPKTVYSVSTEYNVLYTYNAEKILKSLNKLMNFKQGRNKISWVVAQNYNHMHYDC